MKRFLAAMLAALHLNASAAPHTDPLELPLKHYGLVLVAALLGGLVSFYGKVRAGTVSAANLFHLIGELATSAFAGLLVFWFCVYLDVPMILTASLAGVAGHMGARAISMAEEFLKLKGKAL